MYSKELAELDRNTVKLMIDEMQEENAQQAAEIQNQAAEIQQMQELIKNLQGQLQALKG